MPFVPAKGRTRGGASTPRMTVPSTPPRPPASPKFQLPPTTVSPQATRLDRVLDLVTSHEANLAENELKVLDLTKRVAQAEDASRGRRDEDRRARAAEDAALRAELASVKDAVKRVEGAIALWSGDTDGIKHEVRDLVSKCRDDSNAELSETKLGFKAVLQDVVDKVAAQLDAVRRDAVATRHNYANADEVAALHEKIDAFEVAERMREAHHRETMNGMLDAMEKMKRRTQKLVGFYNEHAEGRRAGRSEATPANHANTNASSETDEKLSRLLRENATLREKLAMHEGTRGSDADANAGGGDGALSIAAERAQRELLGEFVTSRERVSFGSLDNDGDESPRLKRSIRDSVNGC